MVKPKPFNGLLSRAAHETAGCTICRAFTQHYVFKQELSSYWFLLIICHVCSEPQFLVKRNGETLMRYPPFTIPTPKEMTGKRSGKFFEAALAVRAGYQPAAAGLLRMCAEALLEEIAAEKLTPADFSRWLHGDKTEGKRKIHVRIGELASAGIITDRSKSAFDLLKHFGSDAIHGLDSIDTSDGEADVDKLIKLVKIVVEDSVHIPQMMSELTSKVPANKKNGDVARDRGLASKQRGRNK